MLAFYLGMKIKAKIQSTGIKRLDFLFSVFLLIFGLGIARLLYGYYDFFLTKFDPNLLWIKPNVYIWQVATFIGGFAGALVLFAVERDIYRFKFKLIPTAIIIIVSFTQLLYPINSEADFKLVSNLGTIGMFSSIIIVITFVYLAIKSSGEMRRVSWILVCSLIGYAIIGMLMSEPILNALDEAFGLRNVIVLLVPIAKLVFLSLFGYGATKLHI
jgi:hypothetical protein